MADRDVAAEVLEGLQEVRKHRSGSRALREVRIKATPLSELTPEMTERIRENIDRPEEADVHSSPISPADNSELDCDRENGVFEVGRFKNGLQKLGALRK